MDRIFTGDGIYVFYVYAFLVLWGIFGMWIPMIIKKAIYKKRAKKNITAR